MKNQLYMLAVMEIKAPGNSISLWNVVAACEDYERIAEQYKHTKHDRLLLEWNIMKGVHIVRANLAGCQMSEDFTNIHMSLDDLAGPHRSGLYTPVYNTIVNFLK